MTDQQKTFAALLNRLRRAAPPATPRAAPTPPAAGEPAAEPGACPYHGDPVLREFVRGFLHHDTTSARAEAAARRLERSVVDANELRVSLPDEIARMIGPGLSAADERARQLRSALNALFKREHRLALAHLADRPKREAREYLESLAGVGQFVAARTVLLALGGHALPLDERLLSALRAEGVFDARVPFEEAAAWLERNTRADESAEVFRLLSAWLDDGAKPASKAPPRAAGTKPAPRAREKRPSPRQAKPAGPRAGKARRA